MTHVTRCAACGTVFRFEPDRLSASAGHVRCGRCGEVFEAASQRVDIEPAGELQDAAEASTAAAAANTDGAAASEEPPANAAPLEASDDDARATVPAGNAEAPSMAAAEPETDPAFAAAAPSFLRSTDRVARPPGPALRRTLMAGIVIGSIAGLLQLVHAGHQTISTRWPAMRTLVAASCAVTGCEVGTPRRIDSLSVESSGLQRDDSAGNYRLSVVVRNRDPALAVRIPWLDLVLTDAHGDVVARRALAPAALGIDAESIAPASELALAATLHSGAAPIAGYTIDLFYP